ncbi:dephospho-CoA kinase/protein folding accessory domain-containing protein [Clostridium homopropionicum DSM 5847]|uniref:Dephospho-CoA kinase/protein folding accessory domain-containing protein n=1 Tax=Clostridium homopropionicum DSM 5847 TaxID=1121318 RepID=A0A0L6Z8V7_9CLOT|nr:GrpB family protein [Clostridium homopropionicum]KOA19416.1 dephospho-CoA kinase/protein folding accessory domain-containing protein [Clostridium homopropionicum DSM 5847]SFG69110.1 GrpB domain, predicted nucleotidyltransferase, UPF0157 family [Clostridium homopropionicum]
MSTQSEIRTIEVVPYNLNWVKKYLDEAEKVKKIMADELVKIHHIGSTAIPGISAKPVIDILVEVKNIRDVDNYNEEMKEIGYIPKGEYGIEGRKFFLKGEINRTHHVHVFEMGNSEIKRHLNFRDYMISHPEEAKSYSELKKELAIKFIHDIDGYCNGKDGFIKEIDKKAEEWAKTRL